jgi:hypothetical protein
MQDVQLFHKNNREYLSDKRHFKLINCGNYSPEDIFIVKIKRLSEEGDGIYMIYNVLLLKDNYYEKVDIYKHYMRHLSSLRAT